jgi:two-component system sensor histidine kinase PilS (NtrC family)
MLARALIVTALLGSAILINVDALADLSNPQTAAELGIIIVTYALTITYALMLRAGPLSKRAIHAQLALDVALSALLVLATGGLRQSVFIFTIYLPIIGAAIVAGRAAALACASAVSLILIYLSGIDLLLWSAPSPFTRHIAQPQIANLLFEAALKISFAYLLAWVSGQLANKLGDAEQEIARQKLSLRDLRTLNEDILASLHSGLITIDSGGQIIFFNHAAELITGIRAKDAFGRPIETIFPADADLLSVPDDQDNALPSPERRLEQPYVHPDGRALYLGFSVAPLRHSDGGTRGKIVSFQDLTKIKELEHKAKRAERLATLGQLAAAMAHEIRNPLAAISGSVEMLQMLADEDDDQHALREIILREVARLNDLISQFLDYSKPRALRIEPIDLIAIIQDILTLCQHRAGLIAISFERGDLQELAVMADGEALQQVIWNLLNNAIEAMSPLEGRGEPSGQLQITLERGDSMAILSVEDSGQGVPEHDRERIFEPFFTTKSKGTGLGLAIIARLIEDHEGLIALVSPINLSGARFVIQLPLAGSRWMRSSRPLSTVAKSHD